MIRLHLAPFTTNAEIISRRSWIDKGRQPEPLSRLALYEMALPGELPNRNRLRSPNRSGRFT